MKYNKKSARDIDVSGKRVLVRCDFNVPLSADGEITDDSRITAALPTIKYLIDHNAAVILCSHLGRPEGTGFEEKFSLKPVAKRLSQLLGFEVPLAGDVVGESAKSLASSLKFGKAMLLENVRFHKEEKKNDSAFAEKLASLADIYVNDAFGTAHRAHASTAGVAAFIPAVCGFLIEKELSVMGGALENPKRPFVAVLGGSKVSDKIGILNNLTDKCDAVAVGGAMAHTFVKALGGNVGSSKVEEDKLDVAREIIEKARNNNVKFLLPRDAACAEEFADVKPAFFPENDIKDGYMGLDIGPETAKEFSALIKTAGTVIWNGPMGVFEFDNYAIGTNAVAAAAAESGAITIIGGGDSAAAVRKLGFGDKMTHISTGGGASLEFLEGIELPGISCLLDA